MLWKEVDVKYDKPVLITEYGTIHPPVNPKTRVLNEERQAQIHKDCWRISQLMSGAKAGKKAPSNALGGFAFVWVDDWWQSYNPYFQDLTADEFNFEWHGLLSQGDGKHSPLMRQPRAVYYMYKNLWQE